MESLIGILAIVAAVWVIYDVWTQNPVVSPGGKIIWTIFALFFSIATAIIYYFFGRK